MRKELIFIGLGRMGAAMTAHLAEEGYVVHGFDVSEEARNAASLNGVRIYESITAATTAMEGPKVVWLMVPSQFVDDVLAEVTEQLSADDVIIDGGNTFFKDTLRRAKAATSKELAYVDCGTSGGVEGARHGASLMVGGDKEVVGSIAHIFETLAAPGGYGHVGATGTGHFVKMVHNGIEYGMMGAIAEGLTFVEDSEFDINTIEVFKAYEHESIITSKLVSWLAAAYQTDGYLAGIAGEVPRGETEAEMEFIVEHKQTAVLEAALKQRKQTREKASRIGTLIAAMRNQFGGHKTIKKNGIDD